MVVQNQLFQILTVQMLLSQIQQAPCIDFRTVGKSLACLNATLLEITYHGSLVLSAHL